jgi:hypothetical protein
VIRKLLIVLLLAIVTAIGYGYFRRSYHPNNRIPPAALHALESDSNLVLYSLYPDRFVLLDNGDMQLLPDDETNFRGYRILGQTALTSPESRRVVVNTVRDAVRKWDGAMAACFEPRHGVRATDASGTHDFLICFACRQVYVYSPGEARKQLGIHASGQPLNDILTDAHVPLPTR